MKVEKKIKIIPVTTYEVYGKTFDDKRKAEEWKKEVETRLRSEFFIVDFLPDTEGNFTSSILYEVRNYLGEAGLISTLQSQNVKFIEYVKRNPIKNVNINRVKKFNSWTELQEFLNDVGVEQVVTITEGTLKR